MSYLDTEYFVWDFLSWGVNFLLATLLILIVAVVVRMRVEFFFIEVGDCAEGERKVFVSDSERFLWLFRMEIITVWLNHTWTYVVAPFFFLLLFLIAIYVQ